MNKREGKFQFAGSNQSAHANASLLFLDEFNQLLQQAHSIVQMTAQRTTEGGEVSQGASYFSWSHRCELHMTVASRVRVGRGAGRAPGSGTASMPVTIMHAARGSCQRTREGPEVAPHPLGAMPKRTPVVCAEPWRLPLSCRFPRELSFQSSVCISSFCFTSWAGWPPWGSSASL